MTWYGEAVGFQAQSSHAMDATLMDLTLLSRSHEVLVTHFSTFGYLAHGLARGDAVLYGLGGRADRQLRECGALAFHEPSFHLVKTALSEPQCRAGLANATWLYRQSAIIT